MTDLVDRVAKLKCWTGRVEPNVLTGGLTNINFLVEDGGAKYVVRVGEDIPEHLILRFNELAAARAAEKVGISPTVVHAEPGIMVMRFVDGRTLNETAVRDPATLDRIIPVIHRCHHYLPRELVGPVLAFWPFHVIRTYAHTLHDRGSRLTDQIPRYLDIAERLERAAMPTEIAFCHNDLLAANFIDTGDRMWLVDWDYAGYNSPLFDLGGLSSNNALPENLERHLLEAYFDRSVTDLMWRRFHAMKCTSLLREAMWSMVSEIHSHLRVDYVAYTTANLERFERTWRSFREMDDCRRAGGAESSTGEAHMKDKILFVDRDGCLIEEPYDERVDRLEKLRLMPEVIPALLRIIDAGYSLVMVTNQDGLGTPEFTQASFDKPQRWLLDMLQSQGIRFREILIDVSYPNEHLDTRKPGVGLVRHYLADGTWDRGSSAMVGDRETDMEFATNLGVRGLRVGPKGMRWMEVADLLLAPPTRRGRVDAATLSTVR